MPGHKQGGAPAAPETGQDRLLTPEEVASFLGVKINTLARWRCNGTGPAYLKISKNGLVRYRKADLDQFLTASTVPR